MGVQTPLMLDKLESLAARHEELLRGMADPQVLANPDRFQQLAREQASLAETVSTFREFQRVAREAEEAAAMAQGEQDPELREMARAEETRLRAQLQTLEAKLRELLMPKDPLADRNIIMEIRAGTGGGGGESFCRRTVADVLAVRGAQGLESGSLSEQPHGATRVQGDHLRHPGEGGVSPIEVRKRRAPRPAGAGDRIVWSDPHFHGHGRCAPRGGGSGCADPPGRDRSRHLPCRRGGRTKRQQGRNRGPHSPPAHGSSGCYPRRTLAAPESRKGHAHLACKTSGDGGTPTAAGHRPTA